MGKRKVDKHGVHLHGCECHECTKTNKICPECGTAYWNEPTRPDMEECHHCGWSPLKSYSVKNYIAEAKALLDSPYCIAPGPEAEEAIPIIRGLLLEIKCLKIQVCDRGCTGRVI
ncbi:MAG: hypothetical protein HXX17_16530 [Geobacteraceae bacterium]|nr:hypothetical protein [Geobacteraceae bacterium]